MQHLLLEMEEEKSMRDAAVIVQPCSQRAFPARVSAGGAPGITWLLLWSRSLSPVSRRCGASGASLLPLYDLVEFP